MSKLTKVGAILTIVASSFVIIFTLMALAAVQNSSVVKLVLNKNWIIVLALFSLIFSITTIIFASLLLKNKLYLKLVTGILALVALIFGTMFYIIPGILFLLGGIFILCGQDNKEIKNTTAVEVTSAVNEIPQGEI